MSEFPRFRRLLTLAAALQIVVLGTTEASAVSQHVREACRQDYFDFCNSFEVGSPALRQCMRRNQRRLSDRCVAALVSSGEAARGERPRGHAARRARRH